MATKKSLVEKLLEEQTVSNDAIKTALEKHQAEKAEAQSKTILQQLDKIDFILQNQIKSLRNIRKAEKKAKKILIIINDAFEEFKKDGDFSKFRTTLKKEAHIYISDIPHRVGNIEF